MKTIQLFTCILFCNLFSLLSFSQNSCGSHIEIIAGQGTEYFVGNTTGVPNDNAQSGAGSCITSVGTGGQYWYRLYWPGCDTKTVTITTDNPGTNFDTKIHVYEGQCNYGYLVCVAGDDDSGTGNTSTVVVNMDALKVYWIRVGGYSSLAGEFVLSVNTGFGGCTEASACNYNSVAEWDNCSCVYQSWNSDCIDATEIGSEDSYISINYCEEPTLSGMPCAEANDQIRDLWYKFQYGGGNVVITMTEESIIYDMPDAYGRLAIWTSCGGTSLACSYGHGMNGPPSVSLSCADGLVIGETYYIQLGGWSTYIGRFSLHLEEYPLNGCTDPAAVNYNECATADDGSCNTCTADLDSNGQINVSDLLLFMGVYGSICN